jgi:tRNA(Ile)-lysidine synthase
MKCWKPATSVLPHTVVSKSERRPHSSPVRFDPDKLNIILRDLPAARCYWLGLSGGLDSTVLLHALVQLRPSLPGRLQALHVNHHLQPDADVWQRHCQEICTALDIPIECRSLKLEDRKGQSLEALAREQRYQIFRTMIRKDDMLLLAHHQDDQMETFLLQALRGAGPRGLAAMPLVASFGSGYLARPLLGFTRDQLRHWGEGQRLTWLDDPSNLDIRFDRNFLRRQVMPVIKQRWPSAAETMARSAGHCGETLELLAAVAEDDLRDCARNEGRMLPVAALERLGKARAKNLLRHWIEKLQLPPPPARKLEQIISELLTAGADRNPCVSWEGAEVRRYRGHLYGLTPLPQPVGSEFNLKLGEAKMLGTGMGALRLAKAMDGERLRSADYPPGGLSVRFRTGGEVCKPASRAHERPLKKWLQELRVVPWMRERLPLLYIGEQLAGVAGLFVCAAFAAGKDEPGLRIEWLSPPALH